MEFQYRVAWSVTGVLSVLLRVTETAWSCMENQILVTDRPWLQLMYYAPSRLWCPNFRVQRDGGMEVWRYGGMEIWRYGGIEI